LEKTGEATAKRLKGFWRTPRLAQEQASKIYLPTNQILRSLRPFRPLTTATEPGPSYLFHSHPPQRRGSPWCKAPGSNRPKHLAYSSRCVQGPFRCTTYPHMSQLSPPRPPSQVCMHSRPRIPAWLQILRLPDRQRFPLKVLRPPYPFTCHCICTAQAASTYKTGTSLC